MTVFTKAKLLVVWGIVFLVIAVTLAVLGFAGVGAHEAWTFNMLVIVFLILVALFLFIRSRASRS